MAESFDSKRGHYLVRPKKVSTYATREVQEFLHANGSLTVINLVEVIVK